MTTLRFRERLVLELNTRQQVNPRYSLRAFAALLEVDHASLSQILSGSRPIPSGRVAAWARKLKVPAEEAAIYAAVERMTDEAKRIEDDRLRQWAAESLALLTDKIHLKILLLMREPGFSPDTRRLAAEASVDVDAINVALTRLLRLGIVEIDRSGRWRDTTGLPDLTSAGFRKFVAERMPNPIGENE